MEQLRNSPLIGGWEYMLNKKMLTEYDPNTNIIVIKLKTIKLHDKISLKRKNNRNMYV